MLMRRRWFHVFFEVQAEFWSVPGLESFIVKAEFFCTTCDTHFFLFVRPLLCFRPSASETRTAWDFFFSWSDVLNTAQIIKTSHTLCCDQLGLDDKLKSVSI